MDKYNAEVINRWGYTEAYKEYEQKAINTDFKESANGLDAVLKKFTQCKCDGNTPDSGKAQALVKELQSFITNNFYTCTDEILKGLGAIYTADERFTKHIDKCGKGTAEFISSAIKFFCK